MKISDSLRRAGKSLRQAKARTLLTSLAIAVGAFTLMMSLAAAEGARQYADRLISSNVDPDALFIVKDESITGGEAPDAGLREYDPNITTQNGQTVNRLTQEDIETLEARDDVTDVRPIYSINATYFTIEGFDTRYVEELSTYNPDVVSEKSAGNLPPLGTDLDRNDIVVPSAFAEALNVSPEELVGGTLTLTVERPAASLSREEIESIIATEGPAGLARVSETESREITLTIRAVTKPAQLSFTSSSAMAIPIEVSREIAEFTTEGTENFQRYFAATAKVDGDTTPEEVKKQLEGEGFFPQTANDLQGVIFTIINVLLGIVGGFGVIALIASVFGIINTQYISVLERTSQIGLMKALGMRGSHVSRLFRYEAAWIGFLGGLIGIGSAWLLGTLLNPVITRALDLGDDTNLLIFVPLQALILIVVLIVIAVIAGFFPARKAAKLDPIEALRTE